MKFVNEDHLSGPKPFNGRKSKELEEKAEKRQLQRNAKNVAPHLYLKNYNESKHVLDYFQTKAYTIVSVHTNNVTLCMHLNYRKAIHWHKYIITAHLSAPTQKQYQQSFLRWWLFAEPKFSLTNIC